MPTNLADADAQPSVGLSNRYAALSYSLFSSAPTRIFAPSPLTETAVPNAPPYSPSDAVRFMDALADAQPSAGLMNTCAAPFSYASAGAPTAIMPPSELADTDSPNRAPGLPPPSVSFMDDDMSDLPHQEPGLANMYAAPLPPPSPGAPAVTVKPSPLMDTESPNMSPAAPSAAASFAAPDESRHPLVGFVKTYAAPLSESSPRAPMTTDAPSSLMDTEIPNRSRFHPSRPRSLAAAVDVSAHPAAGLANM